VKRPLDSNAVAAALAVVAALACALALARLHAAGVASRAGGSPRRLGDPALQVITVRTSRELHAALVEQGVRGRVLVSVGRYLHFREMPTDAAWAGNDRLPLRVFDLVPAYEERVDRMSHLWLAVRAGLAREVRHVVPPATFREKRAAALAEDTDVVSIGAHEIVLHHWGARRTISDRLPRSAEPVVLVIDASWFELGDAGALRRDLERSGLTADLVAISLAEDDPAVGARSRDELLALAAGLRGGSSVAR
jgi:hypothetical protein